jgi:hypothetical protein
MSGSRRFCIREEKDSIYVRVICGMFSPSHGLSLFAKNRSKPSIFSSNNYGRENISQSFAPKGEFATSLTTLLGTFES